MVVVGISKPSRSRTSVGSGRPSFALSPRALHLEAATNGVLGRTRFGVQGGLPCFLAVFLCTWISGTARGEHQPLLPRPQEVRYGSSQISLQGISVRLPPEAVAEDWFGARMLSGCLSRRLGAEVPVVQSSPQGPSISLQRTGGVEALPAPDETPGPDSRFTAKPALS
jgi:hypothetical protein